MPIFTVFRGGEPGPLILAGAQNIGRDLRGTMPKTRLLKANCHSLHMASSSALDTVCYRFLSCNVYKCPELQGKCFFFFFSLSVSNLQHEGQNRGFGKKAKIYFWCRTHHDFCVFWCRASFSRKTVFPTSTTFRRNH